MASAVGIRENDILKLDKELHLSGTPFNLMDDF